MHELKVAVMVLSASVLFGLAITGCSALQSTCVETAASIASAAILVTDAQDRLVEAGDVVRAISSEEIRGQALDSLRYAHAALDASRSVLAGVHDVCETVDIRSAFFDFAAAWQALAPFLSLIGGPSSGTQVADPLVVAIVTE